MDVGLLDRGSGKRRCPDCVGATLERATTRGGVAVDRCPVCGGVWLDRGELFQSAVNPSYVLNAMATAEESPEITDRLSPVCEARMERLRYRGAVDVLRCPRSGGMWLSGETLRVLRRLDPDVEIDFPDAETPPQAAKPKALRPLPSLALSAATSFAMLYALLGLLLLLVAEFYAMSTATILAVAAVVVALQFVLSPWIMDLNLRWLFGIRWTGVAALPPRLSGFVRRVCAERGVPEPSIGLIKDGAPQAFTYGHTPRNARIVVSTGLIDLLSEDEIEAVVAHEIGHAVHWDILLITAAQLVPFVAYTIFRMFFDSSDDRANKRDGKDDGAVFAVAVYLIYALSSFVVLYLSRTREYHADRFSGEVTGNPAALARALVKIGYGLAGREAQTEAADGGETSQGRPKRNTRLYAAGALGIFDRASAKSLAIVAPSPVGATPDAQLVKRAMRWDLWSPWARWYELNSTHPLVARRLSALADQSIHAGKEPFVAFDLRRPRSYWLLFCADIALMAAPWLVALAAMVVALLVSDERSAGFVLGLPMAALGLALLIRLRFTHPLRRFPEMSIAALLNFIAVSAVRPVPCTLRGVVVGRGVPGLIYSEDFVLRDDTGIHFLDYRQPLRIWEFLFGLLKAKDYTGKDVAVTGWFRRTAVPYFEILTIACDGEVRRSYTRVVSFAFAAALLVAGVVFLTVDAAATTSEFWR
jgi:Zn-dependent protease with chaperone function